MFKTWTHGHKLPTGGFMLACGLTRLEAICCLRRHGGWIQRET